MASAQAIVDHDQIRKWADARGARPACVKGTGGKGDTGMIRLDFPGFSGADSLKAIPWKQWFQQFDANNLALLVQAKTARGQKSNFNKLVSRGGERRTSAAKRGNATKAAASRGGGSTNRERGAKAEKKAAKKSRTSPATATRASKTAGREAPNKSGAAQPLTAHREIRTWAEARGARPACVKGTGGKADTGMIRLDFPGFSGGESLQQISWPEWFRQFDANNLALLVQEKTSRGEKSNFNKLVRRRAATDGGRARRSSSRGQVRKKSARTAAGPRRPGVKSAGRRPSARKTTRTRSTRTRSSAAQERKRAD
jgi:hypothetical protein